MASIKSGIWYSGVAAWLFGIADRTIAALSDGFISAQDLILLATAALLTVAWLFLKPARVEQ